MHIQHFLRINTNYKRLFLNDTFLTQVCKVNFVTLPSKEGVLLLDWTEVDEYYKIAGNRGALRSRKSIRVFQCYLIGIPSAKCQMTNGKACRTFGFFCDNLPFYEKEVTVFFVLQLSFLLLQLLYNNTIPFTADTDPW